jgi:hypothetical protein
MINFNDYKFIKKSKSELTVDEIMQNIYRKWFNGQGYATVYYLGAISQLRAMVKNMKDSTSFTKKDLLMIIASMKIYPDMPDEIKNLADDILEEFDYKEN